MADAAGAVQAEARMLPGEQHLDAVAGQKLLVYQESDHPAAEHLFQRPEDHLLGQRVEAPLGIEESVGHQCVEMGMEIDQILTECVNHHDSGGDRFGEPDRAPEILGQALVSDPAEVLEQCPVKLEVGPWGETGNWGSVCKFIHSFLSDIFGERSRQPLHQALPFRRHRYSCQLSHQPLPDTLLVGTRKRALMSLRVRLEGFASYFPFSIAMLLPLFLP